MIPPPKSSPSPPSAMRKRVLDDGLKRELMGPTCFARRPGEGRKVFCESDRLVARRNVAGPPQRCSSARDGGCRAKIGEVGKGSGIGIKGNRFIPANTGCRAAIVSGCTQNL